MLKVGSDQRLWNRIYSREYCIVVLAFVRAGVFQAASANETNRAFWGDVHALAVMLPIPCERWCRLIYWFLCTVCVNRPPHFYVYVYLKLDRNSPPHMRIHVVWPLNQTLLVNTGGGLFYFCMWGCDFYQQNTDWCMNVRILHTSADTLMKNVLLGNSLPATSSFSVWIHCTRCDILKWMLQTINFSSSWLATAE